jgi:hypothetical protein
MPAPLADMPARLPTIKIRARWGPPLAYLAGSAILLAVAICALVRDQWPTWLSSLAVVAATGAACYAAALVCDRRPKVILTGSGIEVALCQTGLLRWNDIIHAEHFHVRQHGALALFLTSEAQARVPRPTADSGTPIFANEAFAGPPIWFTDAALEYSAADILAEMEARRRGDPGPLTTRVQQRR